jgi:O-antigen/teichoic acid export membrane protein
MGGRSEALANAVLYANVLFLSAVPGWFVNLLGAALRGAGNVRVPAIVTASGAVITLALSPLFIFGWGWVPSMGVAGAGMALICFNVGSAAALILYMRSARSPIHLTRAPLEWRLFKDILRVGLLSAIGTVVANLTVVLITGLVGAYGRDAIAGLAWHRGSITFSSRFSLRLGPRRSRWSVPICGRGPVSARPKHRVDWRAPVCASDGSDWAHGGALPAGVDSYLQQRGAGRSPIVLPTESAGRPFGQNTV